MTRRSPAVMLDNARIVEHDGERFDSLVLRDGRIAPVGDAVYHVDLRGHVILPGLINAHDHLQLNAIPPLESGRIFANSYEWIDAIEEHRTRPDVAAAAGVARELRLRHGALKNLLAGTTTVAHHDAWDSSFENADFPVHVPPALGWSHSLRLGESRSGEAPRYGPEVRESFARTPGDQPWIIHLAEGTDRAAACELNELDALGCLAANTVLVHGVALTDDDVALVLERNAAVFWCPASNLRILGVTLEPRRLFDAHRIAIGTDSRLTGSRDLLDELGAAARVSDMSAAELFRTVTTDASAILRIPDRGRLDAGARADCIVVREDADPLHVLIDEGRAAIRAVVRDGVPRIADVDLAHWFESAGVEALNIMLDGRPKLIARDLAFPDAIALEPGLELV